jgi:hypothetical protein
MQIPSKSDFDNWKSDPVTKAFFTAARERVEDAKEVLSVQAGLDPIQDNLIRGLIQAYREMQDFRIEDLEEVV